MTFVLPPRARYHHQVDGKYTLKLLELAVGWLDEDSRQCDMGHLGHDRLSRDSIGHGDGGILNWHGQVGKRGGVLYVLMATAMSLIMVAPASLMYESVRVTLLAIEMHATSAISAFTAGSVAVAQISLTLIMAGKIAEKL
jgi:hypothetical protein